MKRKDFINHLHKNGCELLREGANHSVFINYNKGTKTTVPRHAEIDNLLCKKICKQLQINSI